MQSSGTYQKRTVLVIDDDPLAIDVLSLILRRGGFRVATSETAIGVTQMVADIRPDAIVMDLNMPAMRGDRLARLLRGRRHLAHIPMVLISGDGPDALEQAGRDLVDVHLLPKIDAKDELVKLLRRAIRSVDNTQRSRFEFG